MRELRDLLKAVVKKDLPDEPVALLFSGGTDSLTVLWTLLDLGVEVHAYTFRLSYFESADARVSRAACKQYGIPQTVVTEGPDSPEQQIYDVIRVIQSPRKTHVEVMFGYWFLMKAVKERHVYSGIQADTLYGSNKKSAIHYGKRPVSAFTDYRQKLLANPGQEGLAQARLIASHFGKVLHAPYADPAVRDFFFNYSWKDLNRPKQKMPAILSFEREFRESGLYRHDDSMQCGSHVREHLADHVKDYRRIYNAIN